MHSQTVIGLNGLTVREQGKDLKSQVAKGHCPNDEFRGARDDTPGPEAAEDCPQSRVHLTHPRSLGIL